LLLMAGLVVPVVSTAAAAAAAVLPRTRLTLVLAVLVPMVRFLCSSSNFVTSLQFPAFMAGAFFVGGSKQWASV
jgi:hypothetical protein